MSSIIKDTHVKGVRPAHLGLATPQTLVTLLLETLAASSDTGGTLTI